MISILWSVGCSIVRILPPSPKVAELSAPMTTPSRHRIPMMEVIRCGSSPRWKDFTAHRAFDQVLSAAGRPVNVLMEKRGDDNAMTTGSPPGYKPSFLAFLRQWNEEKTGRPKVCTPGPQEQLVCR